MSQNINYNIKFTMLNFVKIAMLIFIINHQNLQLIQSFTKSISIRSLFYSIPHRHKPFQLLNMANNNDLDEYLKAEKYKDAYQIIKRNPMIPISKEEAVILLNNINALDPDELNNEKNVKQSVDSSVLLYRRLKRQNVLCGFDCVNKDYPQSIIDVSPAKLEEITGLPLSALTPKQRTTYWRLAGVSLVILEYLLGAQIGIDPTFTLLPATFLLLTIDQFRYRGAFFETLYTTIFPEYKKKIICHEAGHFLIAYLLGVPIRAVVTNAWDALQYPEIRGQAGTLFYDVKMAEEVANQKVTRTSLDRLSIVTMAGIAAEAIKFGNTEGGIADERALVELFTSIQPPWNILRIQGQARWSVMQGMALIREHQASYDAIVTVLEQGKGVGDVVFAIEENLPTVLPSIERANIRKERSKSMETDALLRYVQKMTYEVGGIEEQEEDIDEHINHMLNIQNHSNNSSISNPMQVMNVNEVQSSPTKQQQQGIVGDSVELFAERMRYLEKAIGSGDLKIDNNVAGNGLWLNGLQSLKSSNTTASSSLPLTTTTTDANDINEDETNTVASSSNSNNKLLADEMLLLKIPSPLPGYETAVEELARSEGRIISTTTTTTIRGSSSDVGDNDDEVIDVLSIENKTKELKEQSHSLSVIDMLMMHRGYQMKRIERIQSLQKRKERSLSNRYNELTVLNKDR